MDRSGIIKLGAVLLAALAISACGTGLNGKRQEKVAVVNWQRATEAHPEYKKLEQGERILKDLLAKRQNQEELAKTQMGSLDKLRALRQLSESSYLQADLDTRMVELREREQVKLIKFTAQVRKQVDEQLAPQTKEIEDSYQLEIFNLRALLESVKMKPDERAAVEEKLKTVQRERGSRIMELQKQRQALMEEQLAPYREGMRQRMTEAAEELRQQIFSQREDKAKQEQEMLGLAPKALHNVLNIMDGEIDKQQEKNDRLRKQIDGDISSQAVKLAHERGYTIVFNRFKANVSAEDITDKVIEDLRKQSGK